MDYFAGCTNEVETKARYRDLAKKLHPDLGGTTREFQDMSAQYLECLKGNYRAAHKSPQETESAIHADIEAMEAIEKIIHLPGIAIEIVGSWVWVTGQTREVKDVLKEAGFFWASKKLAWHWHPAGQKCRGGKLDLDDIRSKYGSARVAPRWAPGLAA